jgi:hypothetical protein
MNLLIRAQIPLSLAGNLTILMVVGDAKVLAGLVEAARGSSKTGFNGDKGRKWFDTGDHSQGFVRSSPGARPR